MPRLGWRNGVHVAERNRSAVGHRHYCGRKCLLSFSCQATGLKSYLFQRCELVYRYFSKRGSNSYGQMQRSQITRSRLEYKMGLKRIESFVINDTCLFRALFLLAHMKALRLVLSRVLEKHAQIQQDPILPAASLVLRGENAQEVRHFHLCTFYIHNEYYYILLLLINTIILHTIYHYLEIMR